MNTDLHNEFWRLYERDARGPIDAACRRASRVRSDNTIDPADLVAWIDTKVWRMLETSAWPTFHDDPSPAEAVDRIVRNAKSLARWAYLGVCRKHWRRQEAEQDYLAGMSRTERLAAVSTVGNGLEDRERVNAQLDKVRKAMGAKLRAQVAASWPERAERERVAMVLGATSEEDDALIERASNGDMKENAVQQMRSRARKRLADIFGAAARHSAVLGLVAAGLAMTLAPSNAVAREQSGGRRGSNMTANVMPAPGFLAADGEQSGGRGGN